MIKERSILLAVLYSMLTFGIYGIYWFISMTDDAITVSEGKEYNTSGGLAFLFTLLTCGIYGIYWYYKMGKCLFMARVEKNMQVTDNSTLYLVLSLLGLGIVSKCLIQNELNEIATFNK
jgi:hypothetical protein